jgi:hypothetical protein
MKKHTTIGGTVLSVFLKTETCQKLTPELNPKVIESVYWNLDL